MLKDYEKVIKNLQNNNISVIYAEDKSKVKNIVEDLLFEGAVISNGGSVSVSECGVDKIIRDKKYNHLDRFKEGLNDSEKQDIFKNIVGCDFYFCSANALTEKGEIINVDGMSNRVSAIAFGPKKVVMIVGINKIVKDVNEGILRVKKIAAPKNCERLKIDNPCRKLGHCISLEKSDNPDFADGCNLDTRICCNYLVSAKQRVKGRMTVILVDENLGY